MSINIRYIIGGGGTDLNYRYFTVWDQKEKRTICTCEHREDAGLIAGLLNQEEEKRKKEEFEKQVEGVRREIVEGT